MQGKTLLEGKREGCSGDRLPSLSTEPQDTGALQWKESKQGRKGLGKVIPSPCIQQHPQHCTVPFVTLRQPLGILGMLNCWVPLAQSVCFRAGFISLNSSRKFPKTQIHLLSSSSSALGESLQVPVRRGLQALP